MVTEEDVRRVALSLPKAVEKPYSGLPSFRVQSLLFARIHELPDTLMMPCASIEIRDMLIESEPQKFFITEHEVRHPTLLVQLTEIDLRELTQLLSGAWWLAASPRLRAAFDKERSAT